MTIFAEGDHGPRPPLILTENAHIAAIGTLFHAGKAKATMQIVFDPRGGGPMLGAVVSEITPSGWMELRAHLGKDKA